MGMAEVMVGSQNSTDNEWVGYITIPVGNLALLYGISEVLTVPSTVPEPSTAMLAGLGGLAALVYSFKRKRN